MALYILYSEELRLKQLRAKRKIVWKQFVDNPSEIHLAAKLKIIDDQIARPYQQNGHHDNKCDGSEVTAVPEIGGVFLLLALSERIGSQDDPAHARSRNSISERASHAPLILAARASSGNATTTAHRAAVRPHSSVENSFPELDYQKRTPVFREVDLSRRGRNQRKACRVDQKFQSHNRNTVAQ